MTVQLPELCRPDHLRGEIRSRLEAAAAEHLQKGQFGPGADTVRAWSHSWPVAAMVEDAWNAWTEARAGTALAVLAHCTELVRMAGSQVQEDLWLQALGSQLDLPPVAQVPGESLSEQRASLCRALVQGDAVAVHFTSPVPSDPASQLALGEVRLEAQAQEAFESHGVCGILAGRVPSFVDTLTTAPTGQWGDHLRCMCHLRRIPGPPGKIARGQVQNVGWLLWDGPHPPVTVHPIAADLLGALDGKRTLAEAAGAAALPVEEATTILRELVTIGAATAA
jgi:hypothetical protein